MHKYKMEWTDSTLTTEFPLWWFDRNEDSEEADKIAYEAIAEYISKECFNIPVQVVVTADMGDYIEFDAFFEFTAERDIECFSVTDEAEEVVLTEEDLIC